MTWGGQPHSLDGCDCFSTAVHVRSHSLDGGNVCLDSGVLRPHRLDGCYMCLDSGAHDDGGMNKTVNP